MPQAIAGCSTQAEDEPSKFNDSKQSMPDPLVVFGFSYLALAPSSQCHFIHCRLCPWNDTLRSVSFEQAQRSVSYRPT